MLVILALLPLKETKNEAMATKGKLLSLLYCCESPFPPQSIHQHTFPEVQNVPPQKFCNKKCKSFGRLFATESAESQKRRMFIGRIFHSGKFQKTKCRSFSRLFTVESTEFQCRMLICRIFHSRKF